MQQNKIGGEVPKHSSNINSLIQHEHLNTNVHTCKVGTAANIESNETHSPAEIPKICSDQNANQLSPVENHCLPNGKTNLLGSTPPIISGGSRIFQMGGRCFVANGGAHILFSGKKCMK